MTNPYYFTDKNLKIGFKNNLDSHKIFHAISILTLIPIYLFFGIETRYIYKIFKKMATFYARLVNQYKFKFHLLFSARFYEINEEDQ